jgi:hypothetical protein
MIFFDVKGTVHKEIIMAGQIVNSHTSVTFYSNCMKMYKLYPELWGQKNWLLHHSSGLTLTTFFHQGIFLPKTT